MYEKAKNTPDRANRTKPKTPRKISERYLYNAGIHYLKRYTASVAHFKRIMTRKIDKSLKHHNEPSQEECLKLLQGITEKMIELGFLNDDQYTIGMVTSLRKRGASRRNILAKLSQKGLDKELILSTLESIDNARQSSDENTDPDYQAALIFARKKRLGPYARHDLSELDTEKQEKAKRRALGALARAGFSFDIANRILSLPAGHL